MSESPDTDSVQRASFNDVRDYDMVGRGHLFAGKYTITDDREVVMMYSVKEDLPKDDGSVLYVEYIYYYEFEQKSHRIYSNSGRTAQYSATYELAPIYDIEDLCREHFEDAEDEVVEEFQALLDEGRL